MSDQDWMNDPRLKAAAFSGSATNKHYSFQERLGMALQAVKILEELVRQLDAELAKEPGPRVFDFSQLPDEITKVRDAGDLVWIKGPFGWQPEGFRVAVDAGGVEWNYASSRDLVVRFGPITEVVDT